MKTKSIVFQYFALLCLFAGTLPLVAQEVAPKAVSVDANVDLVSRYIWRGQDLGTGPCIQPGLSASWKDFTLGAWGSYTITGKGDLETDLYISKTLGFVTLAVWDYFTFNESISFDYFDYQDRTTGHLFEAQMLLSGGEKLPFNFMTSWFFHGTDASRSLYFELQYTPHLEVADLTLFAGYQASGSAYAPEPSFVNLGCTVKKPIEITDRFTLPLSMSLVVNPAAKSAWLIAGITF